MTNMFWHLDFYENIINFNIGWHYSHDVSNVTFQFLINNFDDIAFLQYQYVHIHKCMR
jgi:hypothetical protein